jgi:hypothetical protein
LPAGLDLPPFGVGIETPEVPEQCPNHGVFVCNRSKEIIMGFGRGLLLWLLGVPLPIIILLAIFWHH